jgi:hypothetical protein
MSCFLFTDEKEGSSKISIDALFEKRHKLNLKQLTIFNKILSRAQKRIQFTARNKRLDQFIWFQIPEYIFGEQIYDKGDCIAYIVNNLETNGFHVKYIHPNTLFVSWKHWVPNYVRTEFKKKTGKIMDEKGNITDPIIDEKQNDKDDINGSIKYAQKNERKEFISTTKYKPTGKFVYNPVLLETLGNRLDR